VFISSLLVCWDETDSFVFFGALAKLRKAIVSFVMSARMEYLGSHWTDFHEILVFFENKKKKFKFH
jgi:hypothetical protein